MTDATPLYSIGTWDTQKQAYTPQRGLSVPSFNITIEQLRIAMKELRSMDYSCHRRRDADGSYDDNDWSVLIERTDGIHWKEIRRGWDR
jgi:hypothetical protein